ncbi:hypothetical protein, partial [uncultured Megasphaera sp.]|uniref:hypothetical protein n=1 Tax=uncultured Megasphaera sp. TaxID=165188 RepID=UPI0026123C80
MSMKHFAAKDFLNLKDKIRVKLRYFYIQKKSLGTITCNKLFSFMVVRNVINSKPIYFTDDY